jgi:hypothetical protein
MPETGLWIGLCRWQTNEAISGGRKKILAVNGEAIRPLLLGIERKHHQQKRRKGAVYVHRRFENGKSQVRGLQGTKG